MVPFSCTFALPTSFSGIGSGANMSTFALLRRNGSVKFDVERVDLNIWVLPALFWRHIYMCDIGVCCRLLESPNDQSMNFELRAPFASDNSTPIDLTPMMRDDENLCGLIFGNSDLNEFATVLELGLTMTTEGYCSLTSSPLNECHEPELTHIAPPGLYQLNRCLSMLEHVYIYGFALRHEPPKIFG